MIGIQNAKKSLAMNAGVTNGQTVTAVVDTLGYDYLTMDVITTTSNSTSNKLATLTLAESDDATTYANVSGFVGGTDFTVASAVTAASSNVLPIATINVDCKARKRYLKLSLSPVTTQDIHVLSQLTRGEQAPVGATAQNSGVVVNG